MDHFAPLLAEILGTAVGPLRLDEVVVPDWARRRLARTGRGELHLESRSWRGEAVSRLRLSRILSSTGFEAFNVLVIPTPSSGAPVFGAEFLAVGGKPHLAVVDLQDLRKDDPDWQRTWIEPLRQEAARFLSRATPRDEMPGWTSRFFSGLAFHLKPVGEDLPFCFEAFRVYLRYFVAALVGSRPRSDPGEESQMREAQERYFADHVENEPAVRALGRLFGDDWSGRYTREFLFTGNEPASEAPGERARP